MNKCLESTIMNWIYLMSNTYKRASRLHTAIKYISFASISKEKSLFEKFRLAIRTDIYCYFKNLSAFLGRSKGMMSCRARVIFVCLSRKSWIINSIFEPLWRSRFSHFGEVVGRPDPNGTSDKTYTQNRYFRIQWDRAKRSKIFEPKNC